MNAVRAVLLATACLLLGLATVARAVPAAAAGRDASPARKPRLYLYCPDVTCDFGYLKRELPWLDWVLDRDDADVVVVLTTQDTGAGGTRSSFYVTRPHGGGPARDTLCVTSPVTDSEEDSRRLTVRTLAAALARDLVNLPEGERLEVRVAPPAGGQDSVRVARDPWNHWVYRIGTNGYLSDEQSYRTAYVYGSIGASRVTEYAKLGLSAGRSDNESRYVFDDGTSFRTSTTSWNVRALGVHALGAHWSAGSTASAWASTYSNTRLGFGVGPALEFDVYPYAESSRRALTFGWQLYASHVRYDEITLYGRTAETLFQHELDANLSQKQTWGSVQLGTSLNQYLHDAGKYRLTTSVNADLRLFHGLSLTGYLWAARIRNQLSLPRGDATDSQIIARQRQLATSYLVYASFGVSYRFGSILDSVVNPRLENTLGSP